MSGQRPGRSFNFETRYLSQTSETTSMQYETDNFKQEWFSDDSVNVRCVLSWSCCTTSHASASALKVNFHNSFYFNSEHSKVRPERINETLSELQRISGYPHVRRSRSPRATR